MLRVAVIGLGGIGNIHARVYSQNKEARLVAVCDLLPERAEGAAQRFGVTAYCDVAEMLRAEEIDAVSVCTAGPENGVHHYEPVMTCLGAGKHVLVEKPISNNIAHAREMVRYAKEQGVRLGVDLNHRFTSIADRARKLIAEGALGEILCVNMALWINNPNESSPWFHLRALHPHSIDVMRTFGGPIARAQAFMHRGPGRTTWSNTSVTVQLASAPAGHLSGCYGYGRRTSPFIDSIARRGVLFERCYAPNIPTHPSFTTMLTGKEAITHNIVNIGGGVPPADGVRLLPEILKERGYVTAAVDSMGRHFERGFEEYVTYQWDRSHPMVLRRAETVTAKALPVIARLRAQPRP